MIDSRSIAKVWRKLIQITAAQIGYNRYMPLTFPNLFRVCPAKLSWNFTAVKFN